jgi:hypothetical protein
MAAMRTRRAGLVVAVVVCLVSPAFAKGLLEGTFGSESVKIKKRFVNCAYVRSGGLLLIQAVKGNRKKQTGTIISGTTADPTAAGAVFPMLLQDPVTASFTNGPPPTPPTWGGYFGDVVVTLTGYTHGKLSGTLTGRMEPVLGGASGTIQVDASFTVKCRVR